MRPIGVVIMDTMLDAVPAQSARDKLLTRCVLRPDDYFATLAYGVQVVIGQYLYKYVYKHRIIASSPRAVAVPCSVYIAVVHQN